MERCSGEQLHPAIKAFQKIERDGLKHLQIIGCGAKDDPLHLTPLLGCQLSMLHELLFCFALGPYDFVLLFVFFSFMCTKVEVTQVTKPEEEFYFHPSKLK